MNSKIKSTQRSQGLVNPNQFTNLAIELKGAGLGGGEPLSAGLAHTLIFAIGAA